MPDPNSPRLSIELVPQPCWYNNMRKVMSRKDWDILRRQVYAQYGHVCAICGDPGRLHCHEVWGYDDTAAVQTLLGFVALCEWCHHVKHLFHSAGLAAEGKLDYDRVIAHFIRVNQCDVETFYAYRAAAMAQWEARNRQPWRMDFGAFAHLVTPQNP